MKWEKDGYLGSPSKTSHKRAGWATKDQPWVTPKGPYWGRAIKGAKSK